MKTIGHVLPCFPVLFGTFVSGSEGKAMGRAGRARIVDLYTGGRRACDLCEFVEAA